MTADEQTLDRVNERSREICAELAPRFMALEKEFGAKLASAVALDVCACLMAPVLLWLPEKARRDMLELMAEEALLVTDELHVEVIGAMAGQAQVQ